MTYSLFGEDRRSVTPKLTKGNVDQLTHVSKETTAESVASKKKSMRRSSMDD